jgi:hypothetical protein
MDTKKPWASTTLWGAALLLVSFISMQFFGVEITPAEQAEGATTMIETIEKITAAVGWVMVIAGRFAAKKRITIA